MPYGFRLLVLLYGYISIFVIMGCLGLDYLGVYLNNLTVLVNLNNLTWFEGFNDLTWPECLNSLTWKNHMVKVACKPCYFIVKPLPTEAIKVASWPPALGPEIPLYSLEHTFLDIIEDYFSTVRGVERFFELDPQLIDSPQILADAYRSEGPGAWVQLIPRLFSVESIFVLGGRDAREDLSSCVSNRIISNLLPQDSDFKTELNYLCLNHMGLHPDMEVIEHSASELLLLLSKKEFMFLTESINMHLDAIKIALADTSWQPGVKNIEYFGHGKFISNIDRSHPYHNIISKKSGFFSNSYLELVKYHPLFKSIWDLNYTDLTIFSEGRWIFTEELIYENINYTDLTIFSEGNWIFDEESISLNYLSPEDILETSIDIFKEEEENVECTEENFESTELEDYFEDAIWIFKEDE